MRRIRQRVGAMSAVAVLALALGACSDDARSEDETPTQQDLSPEPPDGPSTAGAADREYTTPDWANPVSTDGDLLVTIGVGDLEVDVYQVDVAPAPRNSIETDPDTDEPLIAEGDDLVYVNYVVRNAGDEPVQLTVTLLQAQVRYDDWPHWESMPGVTDFAQLEEFGLTSVAAAGEFIGEPPYVLNPGEWFNKAANFGYQPGSDIEFSVRYFLADADGERISGSRVLTVGQATIN